MGLPFLCSILSHCKEERHHRGVFPGTCGFNEHDMWLEDERNQALEGIWVFITDSKKQSRGSEVSVFGIEVVNPALGADTKVVML